jgi:hypothetical protein
MYQRVGGGGEELRWVGSIGERGGEGGLASLPTSSVFEVVVRGVLRSGRGCETRFFFFGAREVDFGARSGGTG